MAPPSSPASTMSAIVVRALARVAGQAGADASAVLRAAGLDDIDRSAAPNAEPHVPIARYFDAWREAMSAIDDPAFPLLVAAASQPEDQEVFGFLAISCATLGEAFVRTNGYRALYNVGASWQLHVDPDATRLTWSPWPEHRPDELGARAAMDFHVADMANAIAYLDRDHSRPRAVALAHAAPARTVPWHERYGVLPRFSAPRYELEYPPGLQLKPIASFNSRLRDYFDAACREQLERVTSAVSVAPPKASIVSSGSSCGAPPAPAPALRGPSLPSPADRPSARLRRALIVAMDGGNTTIEGLSRQLGMSARTLQRRLAEEGTRFEVILDEVRAEFARRYLALRTVSASEVAYLLGFAEPSAFYKAFKRWTGMTPGAYQLSLSA